MNKFYAIILDSDAGLPNYWIYLAKDADINNLKKIKSYSIYHTSSESKDFYKGTRLEDIKLTCVQTGQKASAGIFLLKHI